MTGTSTVFQFSQSFIKKGLIKMFLFSVITVHFLEKNINTLLILYTVYTIYVRTSI